MEENKDGQNTAQDTSNGAENKSTTIRDNSIKNDENKNNQNTDNENKKNKLEIPKIKFNFSFIKNIYENQYKKLLVIPFSILFIAMILIGVNAAATGDFINKDVSLKGGVTITIPTEQDIGTLKLKSSLSSKFPANDIETKTLSQFGTQVGIIVEADIEEKQLESLIDEIGNELNRELTQNDYSVEIVGSSLGASFFKEIIIALIIAFLFMALVVFAYFRTFIPSLAVILAALSDILVTLAIINIIGVKLSTAGIAAFLMLIGYSVDTDILLSSRVLKRREGTEMERIYGALKTGLTMTFTTLIAVTAALIFSQSEVIKQIMLILLIGLLVDLINTWIQNVGILRLYLERKAKKASAQ